MINVDVNILLFTLGFICLMILLSAIACVLIPATRYKVSNAERTQHRQDDDGIALHELARPDQAVEPEHLEYCVEHVPDQSNSGELE